MITKKDIIFIFIMVIFSILIAICIDIWIKNENNKYNPQEKTVESITT